MENMRRNYMIIRKHKYSIDLEDRIINLCKKWKEAKEEGTSMTQFSKYYGLNYKTFKDIYKGYTEVKE